MLDSFELSSFVRGHHVCQTVWTPSEGISATAKTIESKDRFAVVVCLDGEIVGRVSANLAPTFSPFLASECTTITAVINWCSSQLWSGFGSGGSLLLLHTNWVKMLCAVCEGTSDQFKLDLLVV